MFERIHNLTDTAAVTAAAHSFVELQNETLLAHEQAMRADKITEVRAENLALLGGLAALGEQLDLPRQLIDTSGGNPGAFPRFFGLEIAVFRRGPQIVEDLSQLWRWAALPDPQDCLCVRLNHRTTVAATAQQLRYDTLHHELEQHREHHPSKEALVVLMTHH